MLQKQNIVLMFFIISSLLLSGKCTENLKDEFARIKINVSEGAVLFERCF